jgi:tetratricopeptide (TPR) repeat protein
MLPLIMAVCGAAGAVAGAFITQAVNEKDRQAVKKYEKVNTELINKRNDLEKRYYQLSNSSKQQVSDLNLKLAQSELEKDALYLAIRLQNELIALMNTIDRNPCLEILVEFKKAVAFTNHVLKELGENLVPISQDYFSRSLIRVDRSHEYSKEQLFYFMTILMNPEQEIINSLLGEVQKEISEPLSLSLENSEKYHREKITETEVIKSKEARLDKKIKKLVEKGEKYLELEQYQKALSCFDRVISFRPNHDISIYYQSLIYYSFNDINKALELIDLAIDLNSYVCHYYYQKSLYLSRVSQYEDALKAIEKALLIQPNNREYLALESKIYSSL